MPAEYDQWVYYAACAELRQERQGDEPIVDDFYPPVVFVDRGESVETKQERDTREMRAKQVCGACAVRTQCLGYALEMEQRGTRKDARLINEGIWGGMSKRERGALHVDFRKAS